MKEQYGDEARLRETIRAAAPRRTTPPGLEVRIMAQVRLRERRRRERQAIARMAVYGLGLSVVLLVVLCTGAMAIDLRTEWHAALLLSAGAVLMALTAWSDRIAEVLRKQ